MSVTIMNLVTPKAGAKHELLFSEPASALSGLNIHMCVYHRDKTRVQMPAKIFPHLKVKC
jgi:hypothetical protein